MRIVSEGSCSKNYQRCLGVACDGGKIRDDLTLLRRLLIAAAQEEAPQKIAAAAPALVPLDVVPGSSGVAVD